MSKAVLISIRPKWCEKIAGGEKTVEVRKTKPKLKPPFKCYIYCTKDKNNHFWTGKRYSYADDHSHNAFDKIGSGKIIGEFICDQIYELAPLNHAPDDVEKQACLTREEIVNYLNGTGYGWHISDLKIYDKLRELRDFKKINRDCFYADLGLAKKDCRYWGDADGISTNVDGVRFARCRAHNYYVAGMHIGWCPADDDFCSYGAREDGDSDGE